jgi:hypothetical protein
VEGALRVPWVVGIIMKIFQMNMCPLPTWFLKAIFLGLRKYQPMCDVGGPTVLQNYGHVAKATQGESLGPFNSKQ